MTANSTTASLDTAQKLLRRFTCIEFFTQEDVPDHALVKQALLQVCEHSDYQIFGICADTAERAIATLHTYLNALEYPDRPQPEAIAGAVYLNFNPRTKLCYLTPYPETHRGVLISCQSAYDQDVNETFGHLPLNLWSEEF